MLDASSSCHWIPVSSVAGTWAYQPPRPQPCSSCRYRPYHLHLYVYAHTLVHTCICTCGHTYTLPRTHSSSWRGYCWSLSSRSFLVLLLEIYSYPSFQAISPTHQLLWLDLHYPSHLHTHTRSFSWYHEHMALQLLVWQ